MKRASRGMLGFRQEDEKELLFCKFTAINYACKLFSPYSSVRQFCT